MPGRLDSVSTRRLTGPPLPARVLVRTRVPGTSTGGEPPHHSHLSTPRPGPASCRGCTRCLRGRQWASRSTHAGRSGRPVGRMDYQLAFGSGRRSRPVVLRSDLRRQQHPRPHQRRRGAERTARRGALPPPRRCRLALRAPIGHQERHLTSHRPGDRARRGRGDESDAVRAVRVAASHARRGPRRGHHRRPPHHAERHRGE